MLEALVQNWRHSAQHEEDWYTANIWNVCADELAKALADLPTFEIGD